jgi:beta-hydroxylase
MSTVPETTSPGTLPLEPLLVFTRQAAKRSWRVVRRCVAYLTLPIVTGYFFPKLLVFYLVCGWLDVLRTRPWKRDTFIRYFIGQGYGTWLTAPFNLLIDMLTLPFRNKGVYQLADLPPEYQAEIKTVIAAAEQSNLSQQIESRMNGCQLGMIFFKWYGRNQNPSIEVPAFNAPFKYIRTIGVSVFNKRKSTSTHFGPLRITLRGL